MKTKLVDLFVLLLSTVAFWIASLAICSADLVQNSGFETNNCPIDCTVAPPWTLTYPAEVIFLVDDPHSGSYHLHLASGIQGTGISYVGTASQIVSIPYSGEYLFSFWYVTNGFTFTLGANIGGSPIFINDVNNTSYTQFSTLLSLSGPLDVEVQLNGQSPGLGALLFVDDVSLVSVPAPIMGAGLPGILFAGGGLLAWWRRSEKGAPQLVFK